MKPLVLTMQAFGPYREKVTLNFADLKGQLLFLIHGATGAGKTTVLDAIVYALFGTTSGGLRSGETLRSDFADPSLETVVDFSFALGDKKYRIERRPKQELNKKRGAGVRVVDAQAGLYEEKNGEWSLLTDRKTDLAEQIKRLFGFEAKQFLQVVLLPQGEFRKFLVASTLDREKILKSLFHTERYEALQLALKGRAQELRGQLEANVREKNRLLDSAEVSNTEDWEEKIGAYEVEWANAQTHRDQMQALVTWYRELASWLEKRQTSEEEVQKNASLLRAKETAFETEEGAFRPFLLEQEQLANEKAAYDAQKTELIKGKGDLDWAQAYEKHVSELVQIHPWLSEQVEKVSASEEQKKKLMEEKAEKDGALRLSYEKMIALSGIEEERKRLDAIDGKYKGWKKREAKLSQTASELVLQEEEVQQLYEEYIAKRTVEEALYHSFCEGQAYELGKDLVEGDLCPVCGSAAHPQPAKMPGSYVTEEEWKKSQTARDTAHQLWQQKKEMHNASVEALERDKKTLVEERATEAISEEGLAKEYESLGAREREKALLVESQGQLETEIELLRTQQETVDSSLETLREEWTKKNERMTFLEQSIEDGKSYFKGVVPSVAFLEAKQEEFKNLVDVYDRKLMANELAIKTGKETLQRLFEEIKGIKGALAVHQGAFETAVTALNHVFAQGKEKDYLLEENISFGKATELLEAQEALVVSAIAAVKEWDIKVTQEKMAYESYLAILKAEKEEGKHASMVFELSDLANGGNQGFPGLTFERYVLGTFLEEVIAAANLRLTKLTRGRFLLERVETEASGSRSQGLDLAVFDSETGSSRPAVTLSGGESFLASLALSLGLADVVQSYAGGIHLDTIFVDEGFGTLDPEALDTALDALASLQESGRLVGIISHVPELKTRISAHLEVLKTEQGSTARFA